MIPTNLKLCAYDPQSDGFNYINEISTAYVLSDVLNTALSLNLFMLISEYDESGIDIETLSKKLELPLISLQEFMRLLKNLGFLFEWKESYSNSLLTKQYLLPESPDYAADLVHVNEAKRLKWNNLKNALMITKTTNDDMEKQVQDIKFNAMVNHHIAKRLADFFDNIDGKVLFIGDNSSALVLEFLTSFHECSITVIDPYFDLAIIPKKLKTRIDFKDFQNEYHNEFELIILSNARIDPSQLKNYYSFLTDNGLVMVHDYFLEHKPVRSSVYSLNQVLDNAVPAKSAKEVEGQFLANKFHTINLVPLESDTAVFFAAKSDQALMELNLSLIQKIKHPIIELGFDDVIEIKTDSVVITEFAKNKCTFGCSSANLKHCDENHIPLEETKRLISSYKRAILLKGAPGTGDFQRKVLKAEALAFKKGFHKAFAFWAGPCSICSDCDLFKPCKNTKNRRPSMEGSGIDVFETVRNNHETLKTLSERGEFVKYFALLLLD
ncbi:DUF2284 domain-containing protein [Eubacteriaceae bacterium ES2]|nr:DUF2284 domain-containing protein [Eubacteriaceae bacterium ES2]